MLKKPTIVSILCVIIAFALFSAFTMSAKRVKVQSKKSHATKLWLTSGHADITAEAFRHWDDDGEISTSCARCHSRNGFLDYIADGTVDAPASIDTTVDCLVCHENQNTGTLRPITSVTFPSDIIVTGLGPEAICMQCHQGRESTPSVNDHIAAAGAATDDTSSTSLRFRNIHYFAAGATQFGTFAKGGYEYSGKSYDARFSHVTGYNACFTCHNSHSLEVDLNPCYTCHMGKNDVPNIKFPGSFFAGVKDPKNIRFYGSFVDYDGDGDMKEGIYYEIQGLLDILEPALWQYALNIIGTGIVYDSHTYPYFFKDTNGNGVADSSEAAYANSYKPFTPRLVRGTYNFQFAKKDPGGFAHGGKYIIQLLYDSIKDITSALPGPLAIAADNLKRGDEGHFNGSNEAWRHWDDDGEVRSSCAKCHSATGVAYLLKNGTNVAAEISNGMLCTTCHTSPPKIRTVNSVTFPSGEVADLGDNSNICIICHQGRKSKVDIDNKIASGPGPYSFQNVHYFPVGAVLLGSEVHGGYEYDGKTYTGQRIWPNHQGHFDTCIECHMGRNSPRRTIAVNNAQSPRSVANSNTTSSIPDKYRPRRRQSARNMNRINREMTGFGQLGDTYGDHNVHKPNQADCVGCHGQDVSQPKPGADPAKFKFSGIRPASTLDYDGDGDRTEAIKYEIKGLEAALYTQIQDYATNVIGMPIIYDSHSYPYFFNDSNGNGLVDPGEAIYPNKYSSFDAALLKATYNYQFSKKEPHGYIHNSLYIAQLLVDSIADLGGNVAPYTWR